MRVMGIFTTGLSRYYRAMKTKYPNILWFGNEARRQIALTFDDGPHPRDTLQVLEALAKHEIRATFFLVGKYAEEHPTLVRHIHENGHQLALHCYRHVPFPLEKASILQGQLARARNAIAYTCGISPETIRDVRPPYGAFTSKTASRLAEWGYHLVMWSSIPQHWMQPVNWSIRQIFDEVFQGAVIVLHDGHGHGRKVVQIANVVIPQLKADGLEFVTIEQMRNSLTGKSK